MERSCRRAVELGLPAVAFTDHADFTDYVRARDGVLDTAGYLECVERCRAAFPGLRILSGVELGEPHRFPAHADAVRAAGRLDRVLGAVHCVERDGELVDMSRRGFLEEAGAQAMMRRFLRETEALVSSSQSFDVLAHLDYPKRYWPEGGVPYREADYEDELRSVLKAAAARGCALEVNTTRGIDPGRGLCPGQPVLRWWIEAGGRAVTLGSDAHDPERIAAGFADAAALIEAAGFRPAKEPTAFWTR
jgi:histidinol-phosphatase (PHP family)